MRTSFIFPIACFLLISISAQVQANKVTVATFSDDACATFKYPLATFDVGSCNSMDGYGDDRFLKISKTGNDYTVIACDDDACSENCDEPTAITFGDCFDNGHGDFTEYILPLSGTLRIESFSDSACSESHENSANTVNSMQCVATDDGSFQLVLVDSNVKNYWYKGGCEDNCVGECENNGRGNLGVCEQLNGAEGTWIKITSAGDIAQPIQLALLFSVSMLISYML